MINSCLLQITVFVPETELTMIIIIITIIIATLFGQVY